MVPCTRAKRGTMIGHVLRKRIGVCREKRAKRGVGVGGKKRGETESQREATQRKREKGESERERERAERDRNERRERERTQNCGRKLRSSKQSLFVFL